MQVLQSPSSLIRTVFLRSVVRNPRQRAINNTTVMNKACTRKYLQNHAACRGSTAMKSHPIESDDFTKAFVHQHTSLESFQDVFRQYIETFKPRKGEILAIGDYGAAKGAGSLKLFREAVSVMRRKHGNLYPIVIVYNDLPGNNFSGLFQMVEGLSNGIKPFRDAGENVFILASGRSMYDQIMPPNSMDIIFCSFSLMWLTRRPCHIRNGFTQEKGTKQELRQFKEQAEKDWETFLIHRATELKSGGYLIVANVLSHPVMKMGDMLGLWTAAFDTLFTEGIITQEERMWCTLPAYFRTVEEYRLPFDSEITKVKQLGLKLLSVSIEKVKNMDYTEDSKDQYSRHQFEADVVAGSLSLVRQSIISGLCDDRTAEEKEMVINLFKQKLLDHLRTRGLNSLTVPRGDIVIQKI